MTNVFNKICADGHRIVVYKNKMSECDLHPMVYLSAVESGFYATLKNKHRRLEYLATRYIIQKLFGEKTSINYHPTGQPFINSHKHISISHSNNYIAIMYGSKTCGIDIEKPQQKIPQIVGRILSPLEQKHFGNNLGITLATKMWSAKESILKCTGNNTLNYRDEIDISELSRGKATSGKSRYSIFFASIEHMLLCWATPLDTDKALT